MNQDLFTIEHLVSRVAKKANCGPEEVCNLQTPMVKLVLEVLCEEINEVRKELRKKI